MIVVLEGIDGCGKTSIQAELGYKTVKYPVYETAVGKDLLAFLKGELQVVSAAGYAESAASLRVMQSLMLINKIEYNAQLIELEKQHDTLVLDRYWPSAVAYGTADGMDAAWLESLHMSIHPADFYVLLDIPASLSFQRRPERADAYEHSVSRLEFAAQEYRNLWGRKHRDDAWLRVDATQPLDAVVQEIRIAIEARKGDTRER